MTTGTTELVSRTDAGTLITVALGPQGSKYPVGRDPSVSADGRFVAFRSLYVLDSGTPRDANNASDTVIGTTIRVSVNTFNEQSQGEQFVDGGAIKQKGNRYASISADGRFVAFVSEATNLVVGDSNGVADIFVRGPLR